MIRSVHAPAAPRIFVIVKIDTGLLSAVQSGQRTAIPVVVAGTGIAVFDSPTVAREAVGFEIIVEQQLFATFCCKAGSYRMVCIDSGKGIALHCPHALTVNQNIFNDIAICSGDGKALILSCFYSHLTVRRNRTAFASCGSNGIGRNWLGTHCGQLHIIHSKLASFVIGTMHIVECKHNSVHGKLFRNRNFCTACNHIIAVVHEIILHVPDNLPRHATVQRGFQCYHKGLVLYAIGTVGIIKGNHLIGSSRQIHGRRDQILILSLIIIAIRDICVLGCIPIAGIIGIPFPGKIFVAVRGLNLPATAREYSILEVIFEQNALCNILLECYKNRMIFGYFRESIFTYQANAFAIYQNVLNYVSFVGRNYECLFCAIFHRNHTIGGDGTALTCSRCDDVSHCHIHASNGKLNIINRPLAGISTGRMYVMECKLYVGNCVFFRDLNICLTSDDGIRIRGQCILNVPQNCPGFTAINRNLKCTLIGLISYTVRTVGVSKAHRTGFRSGQVHDRRQQILILRQTGLPVISHISMLRGIIFPAGILMLLPGVVGVSVLIPDRPTAAGEFRIFEVIFKKNNRCFRNLFEGHRHIIALIHSSKGVALANFHTAAINLNRRDLIAFIRCKGNCNALACRYAGDTSRADCTAFGSLGCQRILRLHTRTTGSSQGNIVNGNRDIRICIPSIGLLISVESKLHICSPIILRNCQLHSACQIGTAGILKILLCIPDGAPGTATVGRCFHGHSQIAAENTIAIECIVKGQRRLQTCQIHYRRNQVFVLQLIVCHRLYFIRADAPTAPGIFIVIQIQTGLLGAVQSGHGSVIPGVELAVGIGRFNCPTVSGETVRLKVVFEQSNITGCVRGLKGRTDCVIYAHTLKGIVTDGTYRFAVYDNICNHIALIRYHSKGLASTLSYQGIAGRTDTAAITGSSRYGNVIFCLIRIQHHTVDTQVAAIHSLINKGKLEAGAILIFLRDRHLCLRSRPVRKQAMLPQAPDLFPVFAVFRCHHQQIAVLILGGIPVACIEIEDHSNLCFNTADVRGMCIKPFILTEYFIVFNSSCVVNITEPSIDGIALGFHCPTFGKPCVIEILFPQNIGGFHFRIIVGITGNRDGVDPGVACIIVDNHTESLAKTGNIIRRDLGDSTGRHFAKTFATVYQRGV